MDLEKLKYPIGKFNAPKKISEIAINRWIRDIEKLPNQLSRLCGKLTEAQLETPYRPGGWTIRQTIIHLSDSHMNAFIRFKLALTEDKPSIKPYEEQLWAELADGKNGDVKVALVLIKALHNRWAYLLKNMTPEQFDRQYFHTGSQKHSPLKEVTGMYSWHSKHHLAHITNALK